MSDSVNYRQLLRDMENEFEDIRIMAVQTILMLEKIEEEYSESIVEGLKKLLEDSCLDVVYVARQALNKFHAYPSEGKQSDGIEDQEVFVKRLKGEKDPVKLAAMINEIGKLADAAFFKVLLPYLRHSDSRVRANTVEAIAGMNLKNAVMALVYMVDDPDNRVKANAIKCIKDYNHEKVVFVLKEMLSSKEIRMVESALYVLEQCKIEGIEELLYSLLSHKYENIRLKTVRALKNYPSRETVKRLMELKDDPDIKIGEAASVGAAAINEMLKHPVKVEMEEDELLDEKTSVEKISKDMKKMFTSAQNKMKGVVDNMELDKLQAEEDKVLLELAEIARGLLEQDKIKDADIKKIYYERLKLIEMLEKKEEYVKRSKSRPDDGSIFSQLKNKIKGSYEVHNIEKSIKELQKKIEEADVSIARIFVEKHYQDFKESENISLIAGKYFYVHKQILEKKDIMGK